MLEIIEKCFDEKKVTSFYFNKEDNTKHLTGYIHAYNDDELLIAHISSRGLYDGFILNKTSELYCITYDGCYEEKIKKLYTLKSQKHPAIECGDCILFSLLDFSKNNNHIVSLELSNDTIVGFIDKYDDNYIYLDMIDEYGHGLGKCIIDYDEVITFACDSDDEQDLKMLCSL